MAYDRWMRWRRPPSPPGRVPPPPGGRDPPPLDRRDDGGRRCNGSGEYAIAMMSMPVIDIGALFIGREDREGDDDSGVMTEDDNDTDAEAGGYMRLGRAFREEEDDNKDGDEQGRRARRRRRDAVGVRDALRGGAVVVVVHGSPEVPITGDDRVEGGRGGSVADETLTDRATAAAPTEWGMRR
jgi:hypothetical protein